MPTYPYTISGGVAVKWVAEDFNSSSWALPIRELDSTLPSHVTNALHCPQTSETTPDGGSYMIVPMRNQDINGGDIPDMAVDKLVPAVVKLDSSGNVVWRKQDPEWYESFGDVNGLSPYAHPFREIGSAVAPNGDLIMLMPGYDRANMLTVFRIRHSDGATLYVKKTVWDSTDPFAQTASLVSYLPQNHICIAGDSLYAVFDIEPKPGVPVHASFPNYFKGDIAPSEVGNPENRVPINGGTSDTIDVAGSRGMLILKMSAASGTIVDAAIPLELQQEDYQVANGIYSDGTYVYVTGEYDGEHERGIRIAKLNSDLGVLWNVSEMPESGARQPIRQTLADMKFDIAGDIYMALINLNNDRIQTYVKRSSKDGSVVWAAESTNYVISDKHVSYWNNAFVVTDTGDVYTMSIYNSGVTYPNPGGSPPGTLVIAKINAFGEYVWACVNNTIKTPPSATNIGMFDPLPTTGVTYGNDIHYGGTQYTNRGPSLSIANNGDINIIYDLRETHPEKGYYKVYITTMRLSVEGITSSIGSEFTEVVNLTNTESSRNALKAAVRNILAPSRTSGLSLSLQDKIADLFVSKSDKVTENSVLRVPARRTDKTYRIDPQTQAALLEGEILYIPEGVGEEITLEDSAGTAFTFATSDSSGGGIMFDGTFYGVDELVTMSPDLEFEILGVGSVAMKQQVQNDICFPGETPVYTDQGEIAIGDITPFHHTINGHPVLAVTRTVPKDKRVVVIPKDTFAPNYPSRDTRMSINHRVFTNNGSSVKARSLVGTVPGVYYEPYTRRRLYNVLLQKYGVMRVNNLSVETLDPQNPVAKAYIAAILINAGLMTRDSARRALVSSNHS